MIRKTLASNFLPLLAALSLALGAWLMGMFGKGIRIRSQVYGGAEKSDFSWYLGLIIFIGAFVGLVTRQWLLNKQPMSREERDRWGEVRAKGKRRYVYDGVMEGSWGFLSIYLFLLISGPFLWPWGRVLFMLGFFAIIHFCSSFVEPVRRWELNEKAYKMLEPAPQHNKPMHPTASQRESHR
jgi:MFS family permease